MTVHLRAALVALAVLASLTVARAEPVFPPASGVGLEPPPGMKVATGFNGFSAGPASIVVADLPKQAYAEIDAKRDAFVQRFGGQSAEDVDLKGVRGFLIKGSQKAGDKSFRKWILVLEGPSETALVSAQVPVDDKAMTDAAIDAALHTVVFRERPGLAAQIAALPFAVGDLSGFQPTVVALGNALVLTDGPKSTDPTVIQPHILVAANLGHPKGEADKIAFSKDLLKAFAAVTTTEVTNAKEFDADGAKWVEVDATGSEGAVNAPVAVTLFVRFREDGYLTMICVAPRDTAGKFTDRFKTVALSVKPKA